MFDAVHFIEQGTVARRPSAGNRNPPTVTGFCVRGGLTTTARQDERVEVELPTPSEKIEKRRVGCVKCSHVLLEVFMQSPEDSRMWLKVKCRACSEMNLIVHVNGKTQVGQV